METVSKTTWVTIDEKLGTTEFDNQKKAVENGGMFILLELEGLWKNYHYHNYAYQVFLLNSEGVSIPGIVRNNWLISNPTTSYSKSYSKKEVSFSIVDPKGICKSQYFGDGREGVINGFAFFLNISHYASWEQYNSKTKDAAQLTIEEQVQQLQAENARLEEKLLQIRRILDV